MDVVKEKRLTKRRRAVAPGSVEFVDALHTVFERATIHPIEEVKTRILYECNCIVC